MRWRPRSVLLAAAVSIAAAAVPGSVAADQPTCQPGTGPPAPDASTAGGVNIHVTANESVVWCSASVIEANKDVPDGTHYQVRSGAVSPSDTPVSNAISVARLLTLAGRSLSNIDHVSTARLNGSLTTLSRADLTEPSSRFEGGLKPIFWINGSETQYLRPLRSPSDTNAEDQIVGSNGDPLDLYVYSGPLLTVTATATPDHVAPNRKVTFTASVTHPTPADGRFTYTWTFQDGATATGSTVTHAYSVQGTWYPVVTVQGHGNDSGGASPPIPVTVGASGPKGTSRLPGNGSNRDRHSHVGGPTQSSGQTPNTSPTRTTSGGVGVGGGTANNQTPAHTGTLRSSSAQTRSASRAVTHPTGVNRSQARRTTAQRRTPMRPAAGQALVTGRLIADVVPIPVDQFAREDTPRTTQAHAPSARTGGGVPPLAGIAGGSVIALLLGSGAAVELRAKRRAVTPARTA